MNSPTPGIPHLRPVAPAERVELLDVLRGFALLGILTVNFRGPAGAGATLLDRAVDSALTLLVTGSFYPLFAFLFGYGFSIQLQRAKARGRGIAPVYLRRMFVLFLIGVFHAVIIWHGDILVTYAIVGLLLLPLHLFGDRTLLLLAMVPLILRVAHPAQSPEMEPGAVIQSPVSDSTRHRDARERPADPPNAKSNTWQDAVIARWEFFVRKLRLLFSWDGLARDVLTFFIVGFVVGRRNILHHASRYRRELAVCAVLGIAVAAAGNVIIQTVRPTAGPLRIVASSAANYGFTAFYVGGLAFVFASGFAAMNALRIFAAPGRIALTIYLMQTIVMTLLFGSYSLGMPQPKAAVSLIIHLVFFFAIQVTFGLWWSKRFRLGPAEWVWRSLTYGERQPLRITSRVPSAQVH